MKKHFILGLLMICGFFFTASSQCIKPPPLTTEQVQKVSGKWKGSYTNNGTQVDLEINITARDANEVVCDINNPPVAGKETMVEYFFCPSGEFHLRKYVGDVSYVFQGVPENNQIKGTVSMFDAKNKSTQLGNFVMNKAE